MKSKLSEKELKAEADFAEAAYKDRVRVNKKAQQILSQSIEVKR